MSVEAIIVLPDTDDTNCLGSFHFGILKLNQTVHSVWREGKVFTK